MFCANSKTDLVTALTIHLEHTFHSISGDTVIASKSLVYDVTLFGLNDEIEPATY